MSEINSVFETCRIANHNDLLYRAVWPKLSIYALRLIVYLMGQVREEDDDFMTYRIPIQHVCRLLGTNNHDVYKRFDKATDELMKKLIRWENPVIEDLEKTAWCCYAKIVRGKGYIELRFDKSLKPFFIALNGQFTTYDLWAAIRLNSHYNLRMYQLIKYHQGMAQWLSKEKGLKFFYNSKEFDIDWLKKYLGIKEEQYKRFCHLDLRVLKPAKRDLREKTDVLLSSKPVQEGRKITKVTIFWRNNPNYHRELSPQDNDYVSSETFLRVVSFGLTKAEAQRVYTLHRHEVESDDEFITGLNEKLDDIEKRKYVGNVTGYVIKSLLDPQRSIFKPKVLREKEKAVQEIRKKQKGLEKQRKIVADLENEFLAFTNKSNIANDEDFMSFCKDKGFQVAKEKEIIGFTKDGQILADMDKCEWIFKSK